MQFTIRLLNDTDSLDDLTDLLHKGYKQLADLGFQYHASYQDVDVTKKRIAGKECYIALLDTQMIATICYRPPYHTQQQSSKHPWYNLPHIADFGQFTVLPEFQKQGIGSKLIELVEQLAIRDKAKQISLNTAETMYELLNYYKKRGYREVGFAQWELTNYRSLILSKKLREG